MDRPARRRKYWIDPRTQGPFIARIVSVWTGGLLLLALLLHFLADEELGRSFYSVHLRLRNTWQILLPAVALSGGVAFLATIGATVWISVRHSHRLGGPVFKFTRLFRQLEEGSFATDFRFRRGDVLIHLGEAYRAALTANGARLAALRDLGRKAEASLLLARERLAERDDLPPETSALLDESEALLERLRKGLQSFDLGTP